MIAQSNTDQLGHGSLSDDRDRNSLLAMKALIESKLALASPTSQPDHEAEQVATPASTAAEKGKDGITTAPGDNDVEMLL